MNNSKRIYRAAIYVRLSKEDGDLDDVRKAESNSISNQKSLILNYLKDKEDIEIVSIREDDGYSGATFDRPAFKLMMQDSERRYYRLYRCKRPFEVCKRVYRRRAIH